MQNFILTEKEKQDLDYQDIEIPESSLDDLYRILQNAEEALFTYKKALTFIKQAYDVFDAIKSGSYAYDFITEECNVSTYEDCAFNIIYVLKNHLQKQEKRFLKFCEDIEIEIEHIEQFLKDEEEYGTYEDQVRSLFYSTR